MGGGGGGGPNGTIIFTWWDGMPIPGQAIVVFSSGVGIIVQHFHTTWDTVITALNAFCAANLSGAATYSFTLTDEGNDGTKELSQFQQQMSLSGNGQSASFIFKGVAPTGTTYQASMF